MAETLRLLLDQPDVKSVEISLIAVGGARVLIVTRSGSGPFEYEGDDPEATLAVALADGRQGGRGHVHECIYDTPNHDVCRCECGIAGAHRANGGVPVWPNPRTHPDGKSSESMVRERRNERPR